MDFSEWCSAVAALGVKEIRFETLERKYPNFTSRNREAFENFMRAAGRSVNVLKHRGRFSGYVNPGSQGMWCSWVQALLFVPDLAQLQARDAEKELALFGLYLQSHGEEIANSDIATSPDEDVQARWSAWKQAMDFGHTL